jgi:hypothetical protein
MTGPGEPTTLLASGYPGKPKSKPDPGRELSGTERREQAAIRRVGIWGAALAVATVLLGSLLLGAMRGGG